MTKKQIELDKEKIATLYESGNTTEQIGKLFGVTPPTIRRFMRKHDIEIRRPKSILTDEQKEQISIMHSSGKTLKYIAEVFNVSIGVIRHSLIKHEEKDIIQFYTVIDDKNTGYNPIQFVKKRTQISNELNLYIPEKWKQ